MAWANPLAGDNAYDPEHKAHWGKNTDLNREVTTGGDGLRVTARYLGDGDSDGRRQVEELRKAV